MAIPNETPHQTAYRVGRGNRPGHGGTAHSPIPPLPIPPLKKMEEKQSTGNTDFAVVGGKLQVRLMWLFRGIVTFLCTAIVWIVSESLGVVKELRKDIADLKTKVEVIQAEQRVRDSQHKP